MRNRRLNERKILNIINRVIKENEENRDEYPFKYEYSMNLMSIEREFLNDDDKLQNIIDVYQSHIKQLKSVIQRNKDNAEKRNKKFGDDK